ncbi:MAG: spore coat polysaccharide biosynthesis protein F [Betaproteobacteria bacterium]|nr:spore coat polysaccharide biosynthesis protein F [Betaproteobacteria bacterium]
MKTTAIIVQARMTSTRLPGKVMMDLAGHTVLAHVLHRCAAIPGTVRVCCAVPSGEIHDPIAKEAERAGAIVHRGSETDVLDRYFRAAQALQVDAVLRVTSDCPLIDPGLCARVMRPVTEGEADYACNNMPVSWPRGLDCEAFTVGALAKAAKEARELDDREHVTPWLRRNPVLRKTNVPGPGGVALGMRWTLDFPEDYEFFVRLFRELPPWPSIPATGAVISLLDSRPEISEINRMHLSPGLATRTHQPKEIR